MNRRVLHVDVTMDYGNGISRVTKGLIKHTNTAKTEHVVLCGEGSRRMFDGLGAELHEKMRFFHVPRHRSIFAGKLFKLMCFVVLKRINLIHIHWVEKFPHQLLIFLRLLAPLPVRTVVTAHHAVSNWPSDETRRYNAEIYNQADHLVTLSSHVQAQLREMFSIPSSRISTLSCWPDYSDYPSYSALQDRMNSSEARREFLFFGSVRRHKGIRLLLKAFQIYRDQYPGSEHLRIAGKPGGITPDEIRATVQRLGLQDSVHLALRHIQEEEVPEYMWRARAVVLPYRRASQSGVLALPYRYRRPVVATPVGGLPELIVQGKTGTVAENCSPEALAEALNRVNTIPNNTVIEEIEQLTERVERENRNVIRSIY